MSGTAAVQNATEAIAQLGSWETENGYDINDTLRAMPELADALSEMLSRIADMLREHAVEPATYTEYHGIAATAAGFREHLDQAYQNFRANHEHELRRLEEPRPGEATWNVEGAAVRRDFIQPRATEVAGWLGGRGAGRHRGPGQWASG